MVAAAVVVVVAVVVAAVVTAIILLLISVSSSQSPKADPNVTPHEFEMVLKWLPDSPRRCLGELMGLSWAPGGTTEHKL